jgi:hypothetical protein
LNGRVLTVEEERFLKDTLRNLAFDLQEDDEDKWLGDIDEIEQALNIFGDTLETDDTLAVDLDE